MRFFIALIMGLVISSAALPLWASDVDAMQILRQSDAARGGGLPGIKWEVGLVAIEGGKTIEQRLTVQAKSNDSLVEFFHPPKIRGQKILTVERNMWFIKPGLRRPTPISARQRLLGQAANGDVAATNYAEDYQAKLTGEEIIDGEICYRLELTAREPHVTYDRIDYWVSKSKMVGVKADFYTVSGRIFKTALFEYGNEINYQGQSLPFVSKMVIFDKVNTQDKTTLAYSDIRVESLPPQTFNLQFLTR